jgi:hypothetical protein
MEQNISLKMTEMVIETLCGLCKPWMHYRVHKIQLLDPIPSQTNPAQTQTQYSCNKKM